MHATVRSAILAGLIVAAPLRAQAPAPNVAVVSGMVIDDESDAPIEGVEIVALGAIPPGTLTNARGTFTVAARFNGSLVITFRRLGYRQGSFAAQVTVGDTTRVSYAMSRATQQLDTVAVKTDGPQSASPRLAAFERRRLLNTGGQFVTAEQIDKQHPMEVTDVLRRLKSLRVADSMGVPIAVSTRGLKMAVTAPPTSIFGGGMAPSPGNKGNTTQLVDCVMQLMVDGVIQPYGTSLNAIPVGNIHGIEVYSGPAQMPAELARNTRDMMCGLVVLWTKAGDSR